MANDMDVMQAVNFITTSAPKISFSFRQKGTELWPRAERTPGPGKIKKNNFLFFNLNIKHLKSY